MGDSAGSIHMLIAEVTFSVLPEDHVDRDVWSVSVVWRAAGRYAVKCGSQVLNRDGGWEVEPISSSRDEPFKARTRFAYTEACELAARWAPRIRWNGMTAAEVLARDERSGTGRG